MNGGGAPPVARPVAIRYISRMKQIAYTRAALKALRKMPANMAERIKAKIEAYATDPASQANNVKALQGRAGIRLRLETGASSWKTASCWPCWRSGRVAASTTEGDLR